MTESVVGRQLSGRPTYQELLARDDAPPGSAWGVFGADDDLGTINLLTPQRTVEAMRQVRKGVTFNLDFDLREFDPPLYPHRRAPQHTIFQQHDEHRDDYLDGLYLQGTSQIDALRHFQHLDHGFYDGVTADEIRVGSSRLGISHYADHGIVGRGVLLDVADHVVRTRGRPLDHLAGEPIDVALLEDVVAVAGVVVGEGDILLLRTGWPDHYGTTSAPLGSRERLHCAGLEQSHEIAEWLWDHGIALVAADNTAVEAIPTSAASPFLTEAERNGAARVPRTGMLHRALIPLLGMAVGEVWNLDDLAADCRADGVYECLVVAKPLALKGGVGSPANAMAIK